MNPLEPLIKALSRLPGIGEKSATRLSLFIFRDSQNLSHELIRALNHLENVHFCQKCQNITEQEICEICSDPERDSKILCVVEEPVDVMMLEKTKTFSGHYHVLHGSLSPLTGKNPEDLKMHPLLKRLQENSQESRPENRIDEIILATNPNTEGETTALFLKRALEPFGVKISRLASGVPVGGILEYTDPKTLTRALQNRNSY